MEAVKLIAKHNLLDAPASAPTPPPPPPKPPQAPFKRTKEAKSSRRHIRVQVMNMEGEGLSADQMRQAINDMFGVQVPEHEVASDQHYPQHRVLNEPATCSGCGRVLPVNSLVVIDLNDSHREVAWHRPCWDRGKHG